MSGTVLPPPASANSLKNQRLPRTIFVVLVATMGSLPCCAFFALRLALADRGPEKAENLPFQNSLEESRSRPQRFAERWTAEVFQDFGVCLLEDSLAFLGADAEGIEHFFGFFLVKCCPTISAICSCQEFLCDSSRQNGFEITERVRLCSA